MNRGPAPAAGTHQCQAPHSPHSCWSSPSSRFSGHTPFPPYGWMLKTPTCSSSWHWDPTHCRSWHHGLGHPHAVWLQERAPCPLTQVAGTCPSQHTHTGQKVRISRQLGQERSKKMRQAAVVRRRAQLDTCTDQPCLTDRRPLLYLLCLPLLCSSLLPFPCMSPMGLYSSVDSRTPPRSGLQSYPLQSPCSSSWKWHL